MDFFAKINFTILYKFPWCSWLSHNEGLQFEPERKHFLLLLLEIKSDNIKSVNNVGCTGRISGMLDSLTAGGSFLQRQFANFSTREEIKVLKPALAPASK